MSKRLPVPPELQLYGRLEAAEILGVHPNTFDKMRKRGEIPPPNHLIGKRKLPAGLASPGVV
jgi:hypothetical protein